MTTYLTRVIHFSAAHRYYRPEWSEERNLATFGPCANPHGHGHNYSLEVTVGGIPDPSTGFAVDIAALDALLDARVRAPLDHQHVNHAIPEFGPGRLVPTTENLVIWIWRQIQPELAGGRLVRLRLQEDPGLFVDYFGEAAAGRGDGGVFT
jgi:6-pyruvoyltetrahydropterin/6-carboxytetrahydropterin synthase